MSNQKNLRLGFSSVVLNLTQAVVPQKHRGLSFGTLESLISYRPHLPSLTDKVDERLWDIRPNLGAN